VPRAGEVGTFHVMIPGAVLDLIKVVCSDREALECSEVAVDQCEWNKSAKSV
jgi:hypothetical protein